MSRLNPILALAAAPLLAGAAFAVPAAAKGMSAYDMTEAAAVLAPNRFIWADSADEGPVSVLISLPDQRAYVFRGETMIAATAVSTGKGGKETPLGTFTILQKDKDHRSNKYSDAPMPYMQRLTWDGVAMHAGANPGFPASHGCIRLPTEFARRLFGITALGATVEVTDVAFVGDPMPVDDFAAIDDGAATKAANEAAQRRLTRKLARR